MSEITLTPHQQHAITFVLDTLKASTTTLAIRGLAGTGKSALMPHLRTAIQEAHQCAVAIGAPTHRAAMILKQKGLADADTIHSLAMRPRFDNAYQDACAMLGKPLYGSVTLDEQERPVCPPWDEDGDTLLAEAKRSWQRLDSWPGEVALRERAQRFGAAKTLRSVGINGRAHIIGQEPKPNPGTILLCDEGSMVGRELLTLCEAAYQAVVLIGDPGQLPPVNDIAVLAQLPGFDLHEVHRQQEGSSILRCAYAARAGTAQWRGSAQQWAPDVLYADYFPLDRATSVPILVWRNSVRLEVTRALRAGLGYDELYLHPGEPLICRTTNREDKVDGLYTNAQFRVVEVEPANPRLLLIAPEGEPDAIQEVTAHMEELDGAYVEPGATPFRFGYVLTVHTAQGGEWPWVAVDLQELLAQRGMSARQGRLDESAQWAYTAITRAKEKLVLLTQRVFR